MPINIGETLEKRYRIDRKLGQGGFGAVYHAMDLRINVACAIKECLDTSDAATRQFKREASMLAELRHPYLPLVTDYFELQAKVIAFRTKADVVLSNHVDEALDSINRDKKQTWSRELLNIWGGHLLVLLYKGLYQNC
jgi:serine/threonine protein kinase